MKAPVFFIVYFATAHGGIGHARRSERLRHLILQYAEQGQKKIFIEIFPFQSEIHFLNWIEKKSPDVIFFDVRESVKKNTLLRLKNRGILSILCDSDDLSVLEIAYYHVRSLPYHPFLYDIEKKEKERNNYIEKDVFSKNDFKYELPLANLYGPSYLCIARCEKEDSSPSKIKKIIVYLGVFYASKTILKSYVEQWKNIFKVSFWLEEQQDVFLDFTIIIDHKDLQERENIRQFFSETTRNFLHSSPEENIFLSHSYEVLDVLPEKEMLKILAKCDLFLSHFGLSFLQSIDAKIPAALLLPSSYHREISHFYFSKFILENITQYDFLHNVARDYAQRMQLASDEKKLAKILFALTDFFAAPRYEQENNFFCGCIGDSNKNLLLDASRSPRTDNIANEKNKFFPHASAMVKERFATYFSKYCGDCNEVKKKNYDLKNINPFICYCCGGKNLRILHRFPTFSWQYCDDCFSASQLRYGLEDIFPKNFPDYNCDYFGKEYQKIYGLTYKEDEKNIKRRCKMRLQHICSLMSKNSTDGATKGFCLDVGAAYGFFLDIMQDKGFSTCGIEISMHAADFARQRHEILVGDALKLDFSELLKSCHASYFAVVTMWYVIEHFSSLKTILKKIANVQSSGGIFAFSTPNFKGISARKSKKTFIAQSPKDHFHLFTVKGLVHLLGQSGYFLVKVVSTGIHKDRYQKFFPLLSRFIPFLLYKTFAQKKNWGDTMELYFSKK